MHSREEEAILGQVCKGVTLRMLGRVNDQTLLIGVQVDLDHDFALKKAIVDDRAKHFLVAEALVDHAHHHAPALVKSTRGLS